MPQPFEPSWQVFGLLLAYSAAVMGASVLGGLLPEWIRLTHFRMQLLISFVGGVMLGIAVFHMIPHALIAAPDSVDRVAWGLMLGLLATFFLLRFFHFHQHGPADFGTPISGDDALGCNHEHTSQSSQDQPEHDRGHHHGPQIAATANHRWLAVLVGLGLHTLTDGVALASGVLTELVHHPELWFPGLGIFLAVLLHKPLDAVSITSLMHPVTTPGRRLLVNIGFAIMCPLGAFLFVYFASSVGTQLGAWAVWGLSFSAGVFLCISLSDLLPEMEFHDHNRLHLSAALLLGISVAWSIGLLEGEHAHSHGPATVETHESHDHHDHNHAH